MRTDYAVVGSGITGASVAYHLSERTDATVTVFESAPAVGGAKTAASNAVFRMSGPPALRRLKGYGLSLYNQLLAEPAADHGEETAYERLDRLEVATTAEAATALRSRAEETAGRYVPAEDLSASVMAPHLRTEAATGALRYPDAIRFDPGVLVTELFARARANGVRVETDTRVTDVLTEDGRVTGLATDAGDVAADAVVAAAGAHNARVAEWAGVSLPQRHDVAVLRAVEPPRPLAYTFPNLKHADTGVFYTGRSDGAVVVGDSGSGYDECERRDPDAQPDLPAEREERIDAAAEAIAPILSTERVDKLAEWTGYACKTPDGFPILGLTAVDGFAVTAFDSEGIQLAPAAGRIVADQLVDGTSDFALPAVRPTRFNPDR